MSRNELTRLRVLIDIADGHLSVADATGLLGVGRRQVYRLLDAFRACGPDGLISRKRGGPSNRALGAVFRETVLAIVCEPPSAQPRRRELVDDHLPLRTSTCRPAPTTARQACAPFAAWDGVRMRGE